MTPKGKKAFKASKTSMNARYGLLSTQWNKFVVDVMLDNAEKELMSQGVKSRNIVKIEVPGAYELPRQLKECLKRTLTRS